MENPEINIEKFILFHKGRISLLKNIEEEIHGKLIFQICFLGFESLAKVIYSEENSSKKRFIDLLSKTIKEDEATHLYNFWRNPLVHEGFIINHWTILEAWGNKDTEYISFPKTNSIRSSVEYPPGSIIAMYENLINHLEEHFKKINTKILPIQTNSKL